MVDWFYGQAMPTFNREGSSLKLITTDTDSFIFSVEYSDATRSFYSDLADISPSLDFGTYGDDHPLFTENPDRYQWLKDLQKENKGVLGKMKVINKMKVKNNKPFLIYSFIIL